MGLFSFGGSKSKTRSKGSSQSSSFGEQDSLQFDRAISGSESGGFARSGSQDFTRGTARDTVAFDDVFARLFGSAESVAANLDPSLLTSAANTLFSGGSEFLAGIGGDAGTEFLTERLSSGNELLESEIALLGEDIGRFLETEVAPGIRSSAIQAGSFGGGRQGVAEGEASRAAIEQFTRGASALRSEDLARRDAIAGSLADRDLAGRQLGVSALPGLAGIAELGFGAEFEPILRLASVLGDPTVLGQSDTIGAGSSFSNAEDFARAFSDSFGLGASRGRSGSQSTSSTSSKGSSGSLKLGFI